MDHDDDEAMVPANEMLIRALKGLGFNLDLETDDRQARVG